MSFYVLIVLVFVGAIVFFAIVGRIGDFANFDALQLVGSIGAVCATILAAIFAIVLAVVTIELHSAKFKADILNREYGTSYTAEEVYYGRSVIDTVRELDRKRIEINGDILQK